MSSEHWTIVFTKSKVLRLQDLSFFDHLPPSIYIFYGIKVYKKSIFLTTYPPPLVNVVCERPLTLRARAGKSESTNMILCKSSCQSFLASLFWRLSLARFSHDNQSKSNLFSRLKIFFSSSQFIYFWNQNKLRIFVWQKLDMGNEYFRAYFVWAQTNQTKYMP